MAKVFAATQMKSVFGDNKPNCLIIDEIDGVQGGEASAIKHLIKFVTGKPRKSKSKKQQEEQVDKASTTESGAKIQPATELRRPIICICNDQYVPALRELRKHAQGKVVVLDS